MSNFRADLHCHTTCSDGSLTPIEIIKLAKEKGLSALSITDHDTIEAYSTALSAAAQENILLLTGVEFSTVFQGTSIHVLGYGFHTDNPELLNLCSRHTDRRRQRNLDILGLLSRHNMPLTEEEIINSTPMMPERRTIGRPHIALAMVKKGYVDTIQDAFRKYIGEGRPCFAQGNPFTIEETLDVIHKAHGAAVIAHPHLITQQAIIDALLSMDFDGIECYYGNFATKDNKKWLKIAESKGWLITGGSDFHGDIKPNIELGRSWIGEEKYSQIYNFLNKSLYKS